MLMVSIIEPVSYQNSNFPTERFGTKFESNLSQFYDLCSMFAACLGELLNNNFNNDLFDSD